MNAPQALNAPQPVKLTIDDFLLLDRSGAFDRYAKTELINGVIVATNAQYSAHARVKTRMLLALAPAIRSAMPGFEVLIEVSVAMPNDSMPEPDLVVTSFVGGREPVPVGTVALVIEVSDTTFSSDLGEKAKLYAAHGVPEYWVVDIEGGVVHQLWRPDTDGYAERREVSLGEPLAAATIDALNVETNGLN